ncbi:MAG: ATP-grasp domain-containing protein [Deltaproteobacteria bacterium]|uniref:ATP-grasp domain-containing protein n=1 Tax=Candidatus Zymogenus saltonus TaxID=2844893 RepID=A0A9D8KJD8_9DELT|nr:ATP-grasp domain-containing protein [Candidatus Zymogenus saltonus]
MAEAIHVLITGVGGDFGQALVKALRLSKKPIKIYGCDCDVKGVGSVFVDSFHVVPTAHNPSYIDTLQNLCDTYKIDAVIPGTEIEMYTLSEIGDPPMLNGRIPVICQESEWLNKYGDKLTCMQALKGRIELAPFADVSNSQSLDELIKETDFPIVIKLRRSSGSRFLKIVNDDKELVLAKKEADSKIAQAFIDDSEGEFSVGVFVCDGFTTAIAYERDLGPSGASWFAETSSDKSVIDYALRIASLTGLKGSANIQVRKSSKGVRLLEINPRFSSLVAARAACGFIDLEWSLELALGIEPKKPDLPYKKIKFCRFLHELIDFGDGFTPIEEWSPR